MCKITKQEEELNSVYELFTLDVSEDPKGIRHWTYPGTQDNFTPRNAVRRLSYLLKFKTIAVVINPEIVKYLIDLGYPVEQITFFSDDPIKEQAFLQDIDCKVVKLTEANIMKYAKQFDGGVINPPFDETKAFFTKMNRLIKHEYILIVPNKELAGEKNIIRDKMVEIENYGQTAFKEDTETSGLIIDVNKKDGDVIEIVSGDRRVKVIDIPGIPPHQPERLDDWMWATKVMNLNLPGYTARKGNTPPQKSMPEVDEGIKVIFSVGWAGKPFGLERTIAKDTPGVYGLGIHKLVIQRVGHYFSHKEAKYAGPEYGVGDSVYAIAFDSKKEANKAIAYYNSDRMKRYVKAMKSEKTHNNYFWSKIPHHMYATQWDENL